MHRTIVSIFQEKAEELKRQQQDALRRMQQEQMQNMQVQMHIVLFSVLYIQLSCVFLTYVY